MSTFGKYFRVTTFGESHCVSVGCIVDGCPAGLKISDCDIQPQLNRRRPGQFSVSTPRDEKDRVQIQSGTENGLTLGTPIAMRIVNEDFKPSDYTNSHMNEYPRPSHADFTYIQKYGIKASSGGGRSSARETIGRVAAGAIAEKYLKQSYGVEIVAFVNSVGHEKLFPDTHEGPASLSLRDDFNTLIQSITRAQVDEFDPIRCPDPSATKRMEALILQHKSASDSVGGSVTCVIRNSPLGLGEPCFDKLEAMLAHAMLSIPATKSFEIGSGFAGSYYSGSTLNDTFVKFQRESGYQPFSPTPTCIQPHTNHSGGVQGGITNGAPIYFTVGFKPPPTIGIAQSTCTFEAVTGKLEASGRHDPCVVNRAVPIVEAMAAIVLMDAVLAQEARWWQRSRPPISQTLPAI